MQNVRVFYFERDNTLDPFEKRHIEFLVHLPHYLNHLKLVIRLEP